MKPRKITGLWRCDGCGKTVGEVIQVGEESGWKSNTATLCRDCLIEAVSLIAANPNISVDVSYVNAKPTPPPPTQEGHRPV